MTTLAGLAAAHDLPPASVSALEAYLALLAADPQAPTSVTARAGALDAHVADSLVALEIPAVRDARVLADLGSGAGPPGIVLAAALPGARMVLVEATRRKADFLIRAAAAAGLSNVEVVALRAEEWDEGAGACDIVTARALAPLPVLAEYAAPLLREGGELVAWKGRRDLAEQAAGAAAAAEVGLEAVEIRPVTPFPAARDRHLHRYLKRCATPARFPRRPGMATKRPLGAHSRAKST